MDDDQSTQPALVDDADTTQNVSTTKDNDAMVLLNLEDMIKANLARIEKLQSESREQKEMVDNVLLNDPTYREHDEKAKEAAKVKSQTRAQIMKQPSVVQVVTKLKDSKGELSELQGSLSEYLSEYQRLAQTNIFEDQNGEEREIINTCKLIKRSSKK